MGRSRLRRRRTVSTRSRSAAGHGSRVEGRATDGGAFRPLRLTGSSERSRKAAPQSVSPGTDGHHRVLNEPDESVWLPLRSIARTSHLYAVRGSRNPFGTAMLVTDRGTYMLSPSIPIMCR
jgi:hypothetical protein